MSVLRRVPSRRMAPASPPWDATPVIVVPLLVLGVLTLCLPVVLFGTLLAFGRLQLLRHAARLRASRPGESLCTFARAFARRSVDTRILRAVHDEVGWVGIPLRPSDRIEEDLRLDLEDVSDDLDDLAARAGRSLQGHEANPLWGRVETVGDLVAFLHHQPSLAATTPRP